MFIYRIPSPFSLKVNKSKIILREKKIYDLMRFSTCSWIIQKTRHTLFKEMLIAKSVDHPHLIFHLVNVLFNFLIFDPLLLDLISQLGDRKPWVNASGVLQQGLVHESVLALRGRRHRQNKFSFQHFFETFI